MSIWLDVAKGILQERLADAERDRLVREALDPCEKRTSRQQPVLARLRRWLGVRAPHTGVVQDQAPNDAPAGHRPGDGGRKTSERAPARHVPQQ